MRTASLLPLVVAALVSGCGSEVSSIAGREETARAPAPPERDLTIGAVEPSASAVVSAVELNRPDPPVAVPSPGPKPRPKPRPAPEPEPAPAAQPEPVPATAPVTEPVSLPEPVVREALAEPAPEDDGAAGARELAPGRTVTVIPVSSGPSIEADEDDAWLPSERPRGILVGGGGGTCRPRGGVRGVGVAGRIPVGVPSRRLR